LVMRERGGEPARGAWTLRAALLFLGCLSSSLERSDGLCC
jgi:hypothetical protein